MLTGVVVFVDGILGIRVYATASASRWLRHSAGGSADRLSARMHLAHLGVATAEVFGTGADPSRCRPVMPLACFLPALFPGAALAQGLASDHVWTPVPDVTSADLAAHGWTVSEAAGLSLGDGQQAVITFWEHRVYNTQQVMRCIASFDANFNQTADVCSQPAHATAEPQ
jgi:hypothetical protein